MALVKSRSGSTVRPLKERLQSIYSHCRQASDDIFSKGLYGDVVILVVQFLDKPGILALALTNRYFAEIVRRGSNQKVLGAENMCDASEDVRPMVLLRDWFPQGYHLFCSGKRLQYKKGKAAERARLNEEWHVFTAPYGVGWGSSIASKQVCSHCILG